MIWKYKAVMRVLYELPNLVVLEMIREQQNLRFDLKMKELKELFLQKSL